MFKTKYLCAVVSLTAILSLTSFALAQEDGDLSATAEGESVKRLELTMLLTKLADEADGLFKAGSVDAAKGRYQQVLSQTQPTGPLAALNGHASRGLGAIAAMQARYATDKKDYFQARQLWEQALTYDPSNSSYQAAYKQIKQKSQAVAEQYPENSAATQELQDKVLQIQKFIFEGDSYMQTGQYDRAVARYKAVLIIDPYNDQARKRIKQAEKISEQVATLRLKQRKESALNKVRDMWVTKPQATVEQAADIVVNDANSTQIANIYEKLQSIIIPECNFTDADLADILNYLQDQSKAVDAKKEGVNIVFKGEPTGSVGEGSGQMIRSLTLNMKDAPLIKILDVIQQLSSYIYKVEEYAVFVFPNTETSEVMVVRTFSVPPNFFPATVVVSDVSSSAINTKTVNIATADVKKELGEKGVKFASGASAAYLPKTAKLVVRNTLDQLNLIDQLLSREANVSTQVEVSAKFLDFSMDKLKDFSTKLDVNPMPNLAGDFLSLVTTGSTRRHDNYHQFGASTALRNTGNLTPNQLDELLNRRIDRSSNLFSFVGQVDGAGVRFLLNALESELGADLLSEPKLTLFNGQKSKIRAVRELRHPMQWDAPKISTQQNNNNRGGGGGLLPVAPANPTDWRSVDVGVTLEVKANATPDRRIDLQVRPEVTEFQGFINYGGDATTLGNEGMPAVMAEGVALMPVFATRSVDTQMQVIDGQTVVMGGFIRSDNQTLDDKVPLLGDIPLVGRLFRSKVDQTVKRNLIIFLTARIIRPDGRYEYMTESEKELSEVTSMPVTQAK